jgi:hypothetical protein
MGPEVFTEVKIKPVVFCAMTACNFIGYITSVSKELAASFFKKK